MLQHIPLSKLKPNQRNPRKISAEAFEKLKANIEADPEFLECRPLLAYPQEDKYIVYAGNQRLQALKKLKWKEAPVIITKDVDEELIKARILLDNHNAGDFDWDMIASDYEIQELKRLGIDDQFFENLGNIEHIESDEETENEVLEPTKDPISKLGDLYQLGNHRLLCGDSTNAADVAKLLDDAEPILMVTDPPYGVNYDASYKDNPLSFSKVKAKGKVCNDDKNNWSLAYQLFPGSVAYIWHSLFMSLNDLENANFNVIAEIIWVKQHGFNRGDYHWYHEPCWYAVKKEHSHNWKGDHTQKTVWEIDSLNPCGRKKESYENNERTVHSTQKPLECMERPIRNNTAPGEGVYDPFLGSGTTLIAAEKTKRICYGMELDPAYCDIIVERYKNYCVKNGKEPKILKNGEVNG